MLPPLSAMCVFLRERGFGLVYMYGSEAPLFLRLVNRNNCVQKLRATLIVTWQANRIDTPSPPRLPLPPLRRFTPARSSGPLVIIRFLSGGFDPRNTCILYRDHAAGGNELLRLVNYAPSLPIGNNVPHGLLIAGQIIRMLRRTGILPLLWTPC